MDVLSEYGKTVKKKLIDLEKPQKWLIEEVRNKTGLYFDDSYLGKIAHGKCAPVKITAAINEILGIE